MLTNPATEPEMSYEEFVLIRDYLHEKSGIYFAESKKYLVRNRLVKRMAELGLRTYRDYFYHVKYDTSLREFNQLMNVITTNETCFFRNEPQLMSFSDEVLPMLVDDKKRGSAPRSLRIWSAGCSTGEEPYTLAILILEKLASPAGRPVEIVANDISESVIQKARRGEYRGITLRNVPSRLLDRYFTKSNDVYRVNADVKSLVKFSHLNLSDSRKLSINSDFDVIFCRNVMIYFSDEVKRRLVRAFYNALRPGGYFYIGHSETLHGISKAFKLAYFKNALVYWKDGAGAGLDQAGGKARVEQEFLDTTRIVLSDHVPGGGAGRARELLNEIKPTNVNK